MTFTTADADALADRVRGEFPGVEIEGHTFEDGARIGISGRRQDGTRNAIGIKDLADTEKAVAALRYWLEDDGA